MREQGQLDRRRSPQWQCPHVAGGGSGGSGGRLELQLRSEYSAFSVSQGFTDWNIKQQEDSAAIGSASVRR
jgi:hypothetical protein